MPRMYLMIGLPAVGKTTFVDRLAREKGIENIVSVDNIIQNICDQYNTIYDDSYAPLKEYATRVSRKQRDEIQKLKQDYIIDMLNIDVEKRAKWISKAHAKRYDVTGVYIPLHETDPARWKRQLLMRPDRQKVWEPELVKRMLERFDEPKLSEEFSDIWIVNNDGSITKL